MPQKKIFAIFAHPDDEAFGPAGYLLKASQDNEVHVVCVTSGAGGKNGDGGDLKQIRQRELLSSASALGIHHVHFLHFEDGCLCNSMYKNLVAKIEELLDANNPEELVTFEPRGVSGHIDHIIVSSVVSYLYNKKDYVKRLMYYAMTHEIREKINDYFVYMPPGYKKDQVNLVIDIEDVWDAKVKAIQCHASQKSDVKNMLKWCENLPKEEYFLVFEK